ncbi:MAG: VRR-NUC domain-containing protein [Bacteroidales bacterium]|nr:VRR-NUC domain-containing protein [Bacteroidales bacterium]
MNETYIKQQVLKKLRKKYPTAWIKKICDRFTKGTPDIICCINGLFIAVELKTLNGVIKPIQTHEIRLINEAGGKAFVARSVSEVLKEVEEYVGKC